LDPLQATPYDRIGGDAVIEALAARFYEIVATDPCASGLRAMHTGELRDAAGRLALFLRAWTGGPRDYFGGQGPCVMALHRALPIGPQERDQWMSCMRRALTETISDPADRAELQQAFFRMADAMRTS